MKELIIVRGVSGCGKSTFARKIADVVCEADEFFMHDSVYDFDATKLAQAHAWCKQQVQRHMLNKVSRIAVSNTTTTQKELKPYLDLAEQYSYNVTVVVCENYHGNKDIHNVPQEKREQQANRLKNSLKLI